MTPLVPITMFGWIPVVVALFLKLKPRHAVTVAFIAAWLFLPVVKYSLPGLPDYTKMTATCWGIFIAAFLFDQQRMLAFRPRVVDLPMILWCLCPIASSLTNELGLYDGISAALENTVVWGFPFLIGRLYFSNLEGIREFALGIFYGGLVYMPLCLLENTMSPQLHRWVYGFHQRSFAQTIRFGGWRPMVFMEHGLMVGLWLASASLTSFWLWTTGTMKRIKNVPFVWFMLALFFTSVMARSFGALALLAMGVGILYVVKKFNAKIMVVFLIIIPMMYISTRATGAWDGYNLQEFIAYNISYERAMSLWTRMENENILVEKALQRPLFGWGGWGRSRVFDEEGNDITVTDGLWIIILGQRGLVGLGLFTLSLLLPIISFYKLYSAKSWVKPQVAPAVVLAVLLGIYTIDNLLNAMVNPIFAVIAGGLAGLEKEATASRKTSPETLPEPLKPATRFL